MTSSECTLVSFNNLPEQAKYTNFGNNSTLSSNTNCEGSFRMTPRTNPVMEEHEVFTSLGIPQHVYISQHRGKIPLVTYHDIGTNHTSFYSFFNYPEMRVILRYFTVYHICAPGHHENAPNISLDMVVGSTGQVRSVRRMFRMNFPAATGESLKDIPNKLNGDDVHKLITSTKRLSMGEASESSTPYPTMEQLTEMFASILVHFNIKYFVGFGVGAGANIMSRYALSNSDIIWALFLVNPTMMTHAYYPRVRCGWYDLPNLQRGYFSQYLLDQLEWHWFGYNQAENSDLVRTYQELARSLNPFNVAGYIQAFFDRTDILLTRPPIPTPTGFFAEHKGSVITTRVYLVTGAKATDLVDDLVEMNGSMDPTKTDYIMLSDCNGMVMEENPDKLAVCFLSFLRSVDILASMTPEKLHAAAAAEDNFPELSSSLPAFGKVAKGTLSFEQPV